MGFLQLDEEKLRELNIFQSRSLFLSRQSKKELEKKIRFTALNYLILNEIISSTIVYDQDAIRSWRFTLAALGASLNFIAICFIQCFLFVDIWTFT